MWSVRSAKSREGVGRASEGDWKLSPELVSGGDAYKVADAAAMGKEMGMEKREKGKQRERRWVIWQRW